MYLRYLRLIDINSTDNMTRDIIMSIIFGIGFLSSGIIVVKECLDNRKSTGKSFYRIIVRNPSYKIRYYALWCVVFLYLISMKMNW